jgi:hypothetical protein
LSERFFERRTLLLSSYQLQNMPARGNIVFMQSFGFPSQKIMILFTDIAKQCLFFGIAIQGLLRKDCMWKLSPRTLLIQRGAFVWISCHPGDKTNRGRKTFFVCT